ncbi:aldehyde ferredoxin oxidoreductase C-terminal domain-containing protein, partial [bacterium]|nr:aldehyde ferredoxin oxidoreductase C-terminal domain-containing protein [candidate division CSSED10-310 bacterium]
DDIAYKRGLGAELALGSKRMADRYGGREFAMQSKGLEYAAYEPRGAVGHGLGYATANRGGCHLNGGYMVFWEATGPITMDPLSTKAKPAYCIFQQNTFEAISASGTCIFTAYAVMPPAAAAMSANPLAATLTRKLLGGSRLVMDRLSLIPERFLAFHVPMIPHTRAISTLTGMPMSLGRFIGIGERGFNLERLFNLREGMTRRDDALPRRLTHELQRDTEPASRVPLETMLPHYYKLRGWDADGIPRRAKLRDLGLEWARR